MLLASPSLICCLIALFLGLPLHPIPVSQQSKYSDGDDEDDTEYQYHPGVLACPVAALSNGVDADGLGSFNQADCSHCEMEGDGTGLRVSG